MEPDGAPRDRATSPDEADSTGRLQQMNTGRDNMEGSGEWPSPHTPPRGPAPGTDPVQRELIERERTQGAPQNITGTNSQPGVDQRKQPTGTPGPARTTEISTGAAADIDPPEHFDDVLDANPVQGGSRTLPDEDERR